MKILVIPDIHLKSWIFDIARYRDTFDRAIRFARENPDTLWCYGNHDVSYPWGKLETGYSPYAERAVISKLEELTNALPDPSQIAIIHRIDNVLFCHGGLTEDFVSCLNEELIDSVSKEFEKIEV